MFRIGLTNPFYCVLFYHPPGSNNDLLTEFAKFLSSLIVKLDKVLIVTSISILMKHLINVLLNS